MSDWKEIFSSSILAKGREYFMSGKAKRLQEGDDGFSATVRGSRNYYVSIRTRWGKEEEEWITGMSCTCPYAREGNICKHMAAVLYLIEDEYYPLEVDEEIKEMFLSVKLSVVEQEGTGSAKQSAGSAIQSAGFANQSAGSAIQSAGSAIQSAGSAKQSAGSAKHTASSGKKGRTAQERSSSEIPSGIGMAGALLELQRQELEQLKKEQEDEGSPAASPLHMEPYRYFQYDRFEKSMKVEAEARKKAQKILEKGELENFKIDIGYARKNVWEQYEGPSTLRGFASARFNKGFEQVRLVFGQDKILEGSCSNWHCSLDYFNRKVGGPIKACEHQLALLALVCKHLEEKNPGDATSLGGRNLLGMADQYQLRLSDAEDFSALALQMQPVVEWQEDQKNSIPTVSFRVGTSRLYKVKKISDFVEAMKNGDEMKFGTKTMIRLGEELLTKDSLPWYRFMQNALQEEQLRNRALSTNISGSSRYYGNNGYEIGAQIVDAIPLYGAALDQFFRAARDQRIEFSIKSEVIEYGYRTTKRRKAELLFCDRNPDIQVEIAPYFGMQMQEEPDGASGRTKKKKAATGFAGAAGSQTSSQDGPKKAAAASQTSQQDGPLQGIHITGDIPAFIQGQEASYFVDEKKDSFCRVSREQVEKIAPVMEAVENGRVDAIIGRRHLRDFYTKMMPRLKEAVNVVEYGTDLIERYLPPEAEFIFYFDLEDGNVLCRPDVHYGLQIHTLLDLIPDRPWSGTPYASYRDREKEKSVLDIVVKYINTIYVELRVLIIDHENEEGIFNLLAYGLEELMQVGEVRMTEAFRRLGLRRHTKFSVGVSVESNLMDLQILSDDLSEEELLSAFYQYQKKRKFVRLKNGDFLQLDKNETIDQLMEIMETMGVSLKDFVRGKMQVPAYRALYLEKMLEQMQDIYTDRDRRFKTLIKEFKTVEDADYEVPASLRGTLRKYQIAGYRWLRTLDHYGFGGILADEMGLGKTLQVIAVLLADKTSRIEDGQALLPDKTARTEEGQALLPDKTARTEDGQALLPDKTAAPAASLVICPASLVYNWGEELRRFAPQLRAGLVAGTKKERSLIIEDYRSYDVLVTSYDLLKRDINEYEGKSFRFEIVDEAQYIKNQSTAAAKSVKLIKAATRFALTGTPIENRLSELWSIFDYLMPGFLYTYNRFHADFEQSIVKFEDEAAAERLRRMASPFILRRRKEDVLRDLPEKLEEVRYAGMEAKQKKLYDGQVVRMKKTMQGQSDAEFRKGRIQILAELTKIRQICCDPSLILANYDGGSAKRETCMELIKGVIEGEHKALIFSQFASMLELLEEDLKKEKIAYYKITGSTSKERRMEMVKAFNEDRTPVFLISLKAGGTGLNLTGADVVIHYDPWWNVAAQNQATDRAHRIGQTRIVTVYKIIVKGTIEERILEMQENKKKLAEDILSSESISSSTITREDLLELLGD